MGGESEWVTGVPGDGIFARDEECEHPDYPPDPQTVCVSRSAPVARFLLSGSLSAAGASAPPSSDPAFISRVWPIDQSGE